jgi:hypothetical protein
VGLEPVLAALVTLLGIALTSAGVFTHTGPAVAPGALLLFVGAAWLGYSLARHDVRLLPGSHIVKTHPKDEATT